MSRESTPALLEELRDIRNATPLREMTPIPGITVAEKLNDSAHSTTLNDSKSSCEFISSVI